MNSCYLLVGRPPPPPPSILLHVSKCNFVARRGPRVKILQNGEFGWNSCCCYASKKSARKPSSDGDDEGILGLLDDDIVDEGDGSSEVKKKKPKKSAAKSKRKTAISAKSKDKGTTLRSPSRRKKKVTGSDENIDESVVESNVEVEEGRVRASEGRKSSKEAVAVASKDTTAKAKGGRGRQRKVLPVSDEQVPETKTTKRRTKKKTDEKAESLKEVSTSEDLEPTSTSMPKTKKKANASQKLESSIEVQDSKELETSTTLEAFEEEELHTIEGDDDDVAYPFPPLICCFGAAQHFFVPSGRPANRMINHEIHEGLKDMFWSPDKFMRAPGGSSSSVALALGNLGSKVAFMGKLGDDAYGECMLHHLNVNNVQTRAVKIDRNKLTTLTRMKILRSGGLRASPIRTCAEDNLLGSDISKAVLKEAKIFYFNSTSLLDPGMRKTTLRTIKTSKKFGGLIFYDLNLPLSLWHSREETITFIQEAWNLADVIEVTKQELEFICGIEPTESFDTKDNDISKFKHHRPEVIMPLWHKNLKALFVTNGTSKIHFYTENDHGFVLGMEDAPINPFTADMSVAGDAIVAGLMKMLSEGLDHITDRRYLKRTIKYAILSGIADQWKLTRTLGFPPREQDEGFRAITEREWRTVGRKEEPYYCSEDLY